MTKYEDVRTRNKNHPKTTGEQPREQRGSLENPHL